MLGEGEETEWLSQPKASPGRASRLVKVGLDLQLADLCRSQGCLSRGILPATEWLGSSQQALCKLREFIQTVGYEGHWLNVLNIYTLIHYYELETQR